MRKSRCDTTLYKISKTEAGVVEINVRSLPQAAGRAALLDLPLTDSHQGEFDLKRTPVQA